jgi:hypothetical protein
LLSQAIANDSLIYYANFAHVRNGAILRAEELVSSSVGGSELRMQNSIIKADHETGTAILGSVQSSRKN